MYSIKYCLDFIDYDENGEITCKTMKEAAKIASSMVRWGKWCGAQGGTSFASVYNKQNEFILCFNG